MSAPNDPHARQASAPSRVNLQKAEPAPSVNLQKAESAPPVSLFKTVSAPPVNLLKPRTVQPMESGPLASTQAGPLTQILHSAGPTHAFNAPPQPTARGAQPPSAWAALAPTAWGAPPSAWGGSPSAPTAPPTQRAYPYAPGPFSPGRGPLPPGAGLPPGRRNTPPMLAMAAIGAVVVIAITFAIFQLSGSDESGGSTGSGSRHSAAGPSGASPCSSPPKIAVNSATMSANGLSVSTQVSSSCSTGDVLTDPQFTLSVSDGSTDVAAGVFNLATQPIIVPAGQQVRRTFIFPAGMYWRTPDLTTSGLKATATLSGSATRGSGSQYNDGSTTLTAVDSVAPTYGSADDAALRSLRDIAAADRGVVSSQLENRWIPQISSKRPGLFAEGLTWTPSDILREHLTLRQRYSSVKLVWSGDWRTFNAPDWWVTVVGQPSSAAESALRWCVGNGLDVDHCYAKMISSTRGTEGTTVLQK